MAGTDRKFTDHNLRVFYINVVDHYNSCKQQGLDHQASYNAMYGSIQHAIESPMGILSHLEPSEKIKAYQAFRAIYFSFYNNEFNNQSESPLNFQRPRYQPQRVMVYHSYQNSLNDQVLTWLLISNLTSNHRSYPSGPWNGRGFPSPNTHTHPSQSNNQSNEKGQVLAILALIALVAAAAAASFVALFYMIHKFVDGFDRIYFNEGWLKTALLLATSIGFGAVSSVLAVSFAVEPLAALAIAAGFSPLGLIVFGIISLTLIGAGVACFATNWIADSVDQRLHADSMDPADSKRFGLSVAEELNLRNKGIDPIMVKCALVAIRAEIAKQLGHDGPVPSYFSRHFNNKEVQVLLTKVRGLRSGALSDVVVNAHQTFNCKIPAMYSSEVHPPAYEDYLRSEVLPEGYAMPSAPPCDYDDNEVSYPIPLVN